MEKVLSVFCDESGDFGEYDPKCPWYLVTLILHEQSNSIEEQIKKLESSLTNEHVPLNQPIHTGPLIRREPPYDKHLLRDRKRLFSHLEHFARLCQITEKTICVSKREFGSGSQLAERIAQELGSFIIDNLEYFHSFDRVIIYYDRGQKEISKALRMIFKSSVSGAEFRTVKPYRYRLFQVADYVCTMELIQCKFDNKMLSKSELSFFGTERDIRKNHLKQLKKMRF